MTTNPSDLILPEFLSFTDRGLFYHPPVGEGSRLICDPFEIIGTIEERNDKTRRVENGARWLISYPGPHGTRTKGLIYAALAHEHPPGWKIAAILQYEGIQCSPLSEDHEQLARFFSLTRVKKRMRMRDLPPPDDPNFKILTWN